MFNTMNSINKLDKFLHKQHGLNATTDGLKLKIKTLISQVHLALSLVCYVATRA